MGLLGRNTQLQFRNYLLEDARYDYRFNNVGGSVDGCSVSGIQPSFTKVVLSPFGMAPSATPGKMGWL